MNWEWSHWCLFEHIFPIFFQFKGGKGVVTAFGAIAPISWAVTGSMFGTWIFFFLVSGYSSLSAVISALLVPFYVWWFKPEFTFPVALVCCLLIYRHHDNIQRLWRGQEDKVWAKFKRNKKFYRTFLNFHWSFLCILKVPFPPVLRNIYLSFLSLLV